jgi:hypothetical protein
MRWFQVSQASRSASLRAALARSAGISICCKIAPGLRVALLAGQGTINARKWQRVIRELSGPKLETNLQTLFSELAQRLDK